MADYPCDNHHSRYTGPSNRVYVNIYREDQAIKLKSSVCGDCLADMMSAWLAVALHQSAAGNYDPPQEEDELEDLWIDAGGRSAPLYRR